MHQSRRRLNILDVRACEDICIGADHRAIRTVWAVCERSEGDQIASQVRQQAGGNFWGCQPDDPTEYKSMLDDRVADFDFSVSQDLEMKCKCIEDLLKEVAAACRLTNAEINNGNTSKCNIM